MDIVIKSGKYIQKRKKKKKKKTKVAYGQFTNSSAIIVETTSEKKCNTAEEANLLKEAQPSPQTETKNPKVYVVVQRSSQTETKNPNVYVVAQPNSLTETKKPKVYVVDQPSPQTKPILTLQDNNVQLTGKRRAASKISTCTAINTVVDLVPNSAYGQFDNSSPIIVETTPEKKINTAEEANLLKDSIDLETDVELQDPDDDKTKRISAFKRLGPIQQHNRPKMTINLLYSKAKDSDGIYTLNSQSPEYIRFHERPDILESKDALIKKYLPLWPWQRHTHMVHTVTPNSSKEQIDKDMRICEDHHQRNSWIIMSVSGYPTHFKKEDVLDIILKCVGDESFIPCFIDFSHRKCKFFVIRCIAAVMQLYRLGLMCIHNEISLPVTISQTYITATKLDFLPRLVLARHLARHLAHSYDTDLLALDISAFSLQSDWSYFLYFPLNRRVNQMEIVQLQGSVNWKTLTGLNLSSNRLKCIEGFELATNTPRLQVLDLSKNYIETLSVLSTCRGLSLKSLDLEGNPLCTNYTDPNSYVSVVRLLFPTIAKLDGVAVALRGELPEPQQNYCPEQALPFVNHFLEIYFPLLDSAPHNRIYISDMYDEYASLTISQHSKLKTLSTEKGFQNLFMRCRDLFKGNIDEIVGAATIARLFTKWPLIQHDPYSFYTDVLYHGKSTLILRVCGMLKVVADSLAEDEPLISFIRTFVLHSSDEVRYKIHNDMLTWDIPQDRYAQTAFEVIGMNINPQSITLKPETAPNEEEQEKLTSIFMSLTNLSRLPSREYLEMKNWDFKEALETFVKLLKLDAVST